MRATGIVRRIDELGRVVIPQGDSKNAENPRGRPRNRRHWKAMRREGRADASWRCWRA